VTPTTDQGPRRQRTFRSVVIVSTLLAMIVASYFVIHVSIPRRIGALAQESKLGLSDAASGECTSAIPLLTTVVAARPIDFSAAESLGQCYESLGDNSKAFPLLQSAAASAPTFSNELAFARAAFFTGYIDLVESSLREAALQAPTPVDVLSVAQTAQSYGVYVIAEDALLRTRTSSRTYLWYSVEASTHESA
jgi:hypothetical protein